MAMASGRDVLLQLLQEVREFQQEVQAGHERIDQQFKRIDEQFTQVRKNIDSLAQGFETLAQAFRSTKEVHERYFAKIGRTLNVLVEQQMQDRERFEDHMRRFHAPHPA